MKEQRKLERFKMNIPAEVLVDTLHDNKEFLKLNTVNISSGGAYFITDQKFPEGAPVKLGFVLPVSQLRDLTGAYGLVKITDTVIRSDAEGIAISFKRSYKIKPYKHQKII